MKTIVELKDATVQVNNGFDEVKTILDHVNLTIYEHDFITILGGNGAGKSTLFNVIAGTLMLTSGSISILGEDVTHLPAQKRANYLARVFQDPKMGTAPRMTVAENLLIAKFRGQKRGFVPRRIHHYQEEFEQLVQKTGNGLEKHLETPTGLLSGGQRQALSLLMATLQRPELLLLDEHTAALDPGAAEKILRVTDSIIREHNLTCLMITHNMQSALELGNRTIMMDKGKIVTDVSGNERAALTVNDLLLRFREISGKALDNDRMLLI